MLQELLIERAKLVAECRALHDKALSEKRDMNADETATYEKSWTRVEEIGKLAERDERIKAAQRAGNTPAPGQPRMADLGEKGGKPYNGERRMAGPKQKVPVPCDDFDTDGYNAAFRSYLSCGRAETPTEELAILQGGSKRALAMGIDTQGGYLAPREFSASLIQALDDALFIRNLCTKLTVTSGQSLGCPSLDNDPADATWTSELGTGSEDSTMSFGGRELTPHPLARRIKVSKTLLRQAVMDVDGIVRERMLHKLAVPMENGYLNGSGAQQPLGVFTASDMGVSTSRDVSTDNTSTGVTADGIKEAKYTLKSQYWPGAGWIFHREGVKRIAKLKDGNGQYMWQPSIVAGDPATLEGFPVYASEYAPNTWTSGLYVGILGNFKYYWIADSLGMSIQALFELYAETNQVGYITRAESDGMPVLEEAFVRVKLGS